MLTNFELRRQLFHLVQGLLIILLIYLEILSPFSIFLLVIIGFLVSFFVKWGFRVPLFSWFLDHFEREEAKKSFPGKGMIFLFIGSLLVLQLFDWDIALASIMILALGDSVSHLFGAKFGRLSNLFNGHSRKLFEGTLMGSLAGFFGAMLLVPFPMAFVASFAAMIAEVIKIEFNDRALDDNLVVPLVAGTVMFLMRMYL